MDSDQQATILIVEDHTEMRHVLTKFLSEKGFNIQGAGTGEIAVELYLEHNPDIILMDIMLPGISGLEATKIIRDFKDDSSYTPILMITARSTVDDVVEGLEAGADDYIIKPFNFDELLARINSAIRLKKLNDKLRSQSTQIEEANSQIVNLNTSLIGKNKELRRKIFDLHSIFEISFELHSILDIDRLINSTLLSMIGHFSCKSALFVYNYDHSEHSLKALNSKGIYQSDAKTIHIPKSDGFIEYLNKNQTPVLLSSLPSELHSSKGYQQLSEIDIELVSPVRIHADNIAMVCLGERVKNKVYTGNELEILQTINHIVSIAVANASLYKEVTQLSYSDGMTGLHNYRYFEMRLKEEVLRHKRNKQEVSLIILDVDYFKNYNDTLGHQAGDEVLRELGIIINHTVRENDIAARYGGEEFAIILPGVGRKGVGILAERLRENVEAHHFYNEEVQPQGNLTISVGRATLPIHASTFKDLIHQADTALYAAKNGGRNRVVESSK